MRAYWQPDDDDAGGFSVTFGDMVFGLLFFFFILSLTIFFNRPDVKKVQQEENKLLRQIATEKEKLKQMEAVLDDKQRLQYKTVKSRIEMESELREERERKKTLLAESEKTVREKQTLEEQLTAALAKVEQMREKLDQNARELYRTRKAVEKDGTNEQVVQSEPSDWARTDHELREKYDKTKRELATLKGDYDSVLDGLRKSRNLSGRMSKLLDETKTMLKEKGLLEVLAELEIKERGDPKLPPPERYTVFVKLIKADQFDVAVTQGDQELQTKRGATADEIVKMASEIQQKYGGETVGHLEADKIKNAPRMYLMINPSAKYGDVEKLLYYFRQVIPVSINAWEE